jgi:uncharacterized protein YqiB (DUF1249 family)
MMISIRDNALLAPARSFASLMELYENNYIFIRRLVPEIEGLQPHTVSHAQGAVDLHLTVIERCPYTTTLSLTHHFPTETGEDSSPDVVVRVYHDARTAEVLPHSCVSRFQLWKAGEEPGAGSLHWRWEVNRFLNRWLRYCLGEGHHFGEDVAAPAKATR